MLVLTRKLGTAIVIDDNILVKVVDIKDNRVRLRIDAPEPLAVRAEKEEGDAAKR